MADARKHIIVIGAGIIGASIGYHLARRGIGVTVVDGSEPASALNRLPQSPGCHLKQEADGRIVACEDFTGGSLAVGPEALTERLLERVTGLLPHLGNVVLDHHTIGERPTPADGFPAVGMAVEVSGLYVAVMHSGITLAPAIGRFAATEILDGAQIEMLAPFRPGRFNRT